MWTSLFVEIRTGFLQIDPNDESVVKRKRKTGIVRNSYRSSRKRKETKKRNHGTGSYVPLPEQKKMKESWMEGRSISEIAFPRVHLLLAN